MMKRIDWGWFLVIAIGLLASLPLLKQVGLPNSHDVLYHAYRVAEMERSWANGMFFPRWAEGLYYGYGSPLWHFYASLTYYLTAAVMQFVPISALEALRLLMGTSFVLMSLGMYGFMRQQVGRVAGILSAIAIVFSPYIVFTAPYVRGAYPELLALALFTWVMWRFGAVLKNPSGMNIAGASLLLYLLFISHNLMGVILGALAFGWILWQGIATLVTQWGQWRLLRAPIVALITWGLGLGMAGYFWLPVLFETDTVYLENLAGVALLDYHNFFVPLADLFAPIPLNDLGAINGLRLVTVIGLAQWVGALVGLVGVAYFIYYAVRDGRRDDRILRQGVFFALGAVVMIFFVTPQSAPLWDNFPWLRFIQFPWRLLGAVAFCGAFLFGLNALWLEKITNPWRQGAIAGIVALLLIASSPLLTVPEWTTTTLDTSMTAYHQSEVAGVQIATTFTDEYRPRTVYTLPTQNDRLLADYADGYPIDKANVPPDVQTKVLINNPIWLEWEVTTPTDFTMEVLNFYWAGWIAFVDDVEVPITPSPNHGFITLNVPQGTHNVKVYLGATPARVLGGTLSGLSLLAMLALVVLRLGKALARGKTESLPLTPREQLGWGVFVGVGVAVMVIGIAPEGILWRNTPYGQAPSQTAVTYQFDDIARLIGYDSNGNTFNAGDTVRLAVYWQPIIQGNVDFSSFVHIGAVDAPPVAQQDKLHPADRPISQWWTPNGYLYDEYAIELPPNLPSGEYAVMVGWYTCAFAEGDCGNGFRPQIQNEAGETVGDRAMLFTVTIR